MIKIAPSILDANFAELQKDIDSIASADRIHIDVMDGQYVPNLSFGVPVLKKIDWKKSDFEVHLMVNNPENFFEDFVGLGAMGITFHIENTGKDKALELLQDLKACGVKAGISIDGYTSVDFLSDEILNVADQVLVMSVKSGFGGQSFMDSALDKIKLLRSRGFKGEIEVDGGVNTETIRAVEAAGADIAVVGSFLMKQKATKRKAVMAELRG
ncbi:ribulose-phosphate 3-epimerase [bacterium DOLZORAL124_38_8]|nr:MAG: ribulose-phosphate 3-epimerase [bacterium DOLZORAL124_38_8]